MWWADLCCAYVGLLMVSACSESFCCTAAFFTLHCGKLLLRFCQTFGAMRAPEVLEGVDCSNSSVTPASIWVPLVHLLSSLVPMPFGRVRRKEKTMIRFNLFPEQAQTPQEWLGYLAGNQMKLWQGMADVMLQAPAEQVRQAQAVAKLYQAFWGITPNAAQTLAVTPPAVAKSPKPPAKPAAKKTTTARKAAPKTAAAKPAAEAPKAKAEPKVAAKPAAAKTAAKTTSAPAAPKPAARKTATRKPAARKTSAAKPAAAKTATVAKPPAAAKPATAPKPAASAVPTPKPAAPKPAGPQSAAPAAKSAETFTSRREPADQKAPNRRTTRSPSKPPSMPAPKTRTDGGAD